jgi:hypothetical protein
MKAIFAIILLSLLSFTQGPGKPKVIFFLYEDCPITIYMTTYIREIKNLYNDKVEIDYVFPNAMSNYKSAMIFCEKYDIKGGNIIIDEDRSITKKYKATITPEVILISGGNQVIYQGRINDGYVSIGRRKNKVNKHDIKDAIEYLLNESNPKPIEDCPAPVGCYITQ